MRIIFSAEKLLLIIIAGPPRQHRSNVQFLAFNLAHHVLWPHAFSGILVMRTTCCVHMMVARVPMVLRRIDPTSHRKRNYVGACLSHFNLLRLGQVFGAHRGGHPVTTRRNLNSVSVLSIDLRLKKQIGSQTFYWIWIESIQTVADRKCRNGGGTVLIANGQAQRECWQRIEQCRHLVAKAEDRKSVV